MPSSDNDLLKIAKIFTSHLDSDDFETAKSYIASFCEYKIGTETLYGPSAIVSSYEASSDRARKDFDSVSYESAVRLTAPTQVEVTYTDILSKGEKTHRYQCKQLLDFDPKGEIITIQHLSIEGEQSKLSQFLSEVGLPPPK